MSWVLDDDQEVVLVCRDRTQEDEYSTAAGWSQTVAASWSQIEPASWSQTVAASWLASFRQQMQIASPQPDTDQLDSGGSSSRPGGFLRWNSWNL